MQRTQQKGWEGGRTARSIGGWWEEIGGLKRRRAWEERRAVSRETVMSVWIVSTEHRAAVLCTRRDGYGRRGRYGHDGGGGGRFSLWTLVMGGGGASGDDMESRRPRCMAAAASARQHRAEGAAVEPQCKGAAAASSCQLRAARRQLLWIPGWEGVAERTSSELQHPRETDGDIDRNEKGGSFFPSLLSPRPREGLDSTTGKMSASLRVALALAQAPLRNSGIQINNPMSPHCAIYVTRPIPAIYSAGMYLPNLQSPRPPFGIRTSDLEPSFLASKFSRIDQSLTPSSIRSTSTLLQSPISYPCAAHATMSDVPRLAISPPPPSIPLFKFHLKPPAAPCAYHPHPPAAAPAPAPSFPLRRGPPAPHRICTCVPVTHAFSFSAAPATGHPRRTVNYSASEQHSAWRASLPCRRRRLPLPVAGIPFPPALQRIDQAYDAAPSPSPTQAEPHTPILKSNQGYSYC
ncbi:hypothetical protein DFH09DRAFT_1100477 [Mycena vulgaris]|nr:hypothetical protein DFH09DRAFT_1100477 [Mycena vulgaris]